MAEKKYNIIELQKMEWKNVLEDCLNEVERRIFISRKKAEDMYIDGYKLSEITLETGLSKSQVVKMIHKCVKRDSLNNYDYGYRGLLPYKHLKDYRVVQIRSVNVNVLVVHYLNYLLFCS